MTQGRVITADTVSKAPRADTWRGALHELEPVDGSSTCRRNAVGSRRDGRGTSLIEILVAVFVLSVGMTGISVLNIQSKRANHEALQRTTASHLARDIVERMRANRPALDRYIGTVDGHTTPAYDCRTRWCDPLQLAEFDLAEWARAMTGVDETADGSSAGGLTEATGCIDGPAPGPSGIYTVAIAWRGRSALADPILDDCGRGSGKYDDSAAGADTRRRVLAMALYMGGGR